jgi:hypothetical protein
MAAVAESGVLDRVVALADDYADAFLSELGIEDASLQSSIAGMLLSFLSEAVLVASSPHD